MLWQRTCHGISCLTHIDKRSSTLADDELDEPSSLSFVSLKLTFFGWERTPFNSIFLHVYSQGEVVCTSGIPPTPPPFPAPGGPAQSERTHANQ